jgi:hypothetical protein
MRQLLLQCLAEACPGHDEEDEEEEDEPCFGDSDRNAPLMAE